MGPRPHRLRPPACLLLLALLPGPASGAPPPNPSLLSAAALSAASLSAAALEAYYGGDPESSLRSYREILKLDPWDLAARRNLVRLLRETGQAGEALGHLELLQLLRPGEEALRLEAAECALLAGKPQRALGYLRNLQPSADSGWLGGLALLGLGRTAEGAAALQASLEAVGFRPLAWYRLGLARWRLGELEAAEQSLRTALSQEPNLTGCLEPLARVLLARGRVEQAWAMALRARASLPGSDSVQQLLRELEAEHPELPESALRRQAQRRQSAVPPRAEAGPPGAAGLPQVRVGLAERARELYLKTGAAYTLARQAGGAGEPGSEEEAGERPPPQEGPAGQVLRASLQDGQVQVADAEGRVLLRCAGPLRLLYADPAAATVLFEVQYGQGSFWAGSEDRAYRGALLLLPRDGGLTAVNLLSVEEYLYSVLPSEMPATWPAAALQAQAVAARSYTLANLGRFAARGFDLLGSVASAAYRGLGAETASARGAVDATRGLVLLDGGRPLSAFYSANCGGHSDTTQTAWGFPSALPAVPDVLQPVRAQRLDPQALARWLSSRPAAYCSHPSYSSPSAYRWQLWVPRRELERRLEAPELGSVLAVAPAGRGLSGRASQARVRGSSGQLILRGDELRGRLGGLRSNLFVVEPLLGPDGLPEGFLFTGAGWGHGVGLCQSGAAGMAEAGWSAEGILRHYYGGAELARLF